MSRGEMRWVAERVRALIDDGVVPEEIGMVGRPLESSLHSLSAVTSGVFACRFRGSAKGWPAEAAARGYRLTEILRSGPATPVDLWIEGPCQTITASSCSSRFGKSVPRGLRTWRIFGSMEG